MVEPVEEPQPSTDGILATVNAALGEIVADETVPFADRRSARRGQRMIEELFDDRPWCITHTQRKPCGVCQSYIAAGL